MGEPNVADPDPKLTVGLAAWTRPEPETRQQAAITIHRESPGLRRNAMAAVSRTFDGTKVLVLFLLFNPTIVKLH